MPTKMRQFVVKYWLPIGLALVFIEWVIISPLKPVDEWNVQSLLMKLLYFSYVLGSYFFISRLKVRSLNLLWGTFCLALEIVVLSEVSATFISDVLLMGTASSLGVLVITLGIYYAANEWRRKNESLRTEIETRKETEKELMKRERELEEALKKTASLEEVNKLKSQFLSMASHELRTPITPIMMQIQMLIQGRLGKLNEEEKDSMRMVLRETKRLDGLIADILDLSRLQVSGMKFEFKPNDINEVIRHAVETMKYSARDKSVQLVFREKRIPPFVFDRDRTAQVMTDLLNNAIKFSPAGGKIWISAGRHGKNVLVKVRDEGIGMTEDGMKKLFRPFSQIDSTKTRKYGGVGLGLSICKGIIENHGGRIWAESEGRRKGSTFIFELPFSIHSI